MTIVKDQKQRDIIKNDLNKNIFVEAGAGSGKTTSLVDRMVSMIKSGIDISKICAITFTKAAAVEFYNRFENALSNAINSNVPDAEKKLYENALLNIDLCFMGTIDAFCNMILSENPVEAGTPLNSTIVSEEEYKFYIQEEYKDILKNSKTQDEKDALEDFFRYQSNPSEAFVCCMNSLLNKRNYKIDTKDRKDIQAKEQAFYDKYQDEIRSLIKGFTGKDSDNMVGTSQKNKKAKEHIINNLQHINEEWSKKPTAIINFLNAGLKDVCLNLKYSNMSRSFNEYFEPKQKYYSVIPEKIEEITKEFKSIQYDYSIAFLSKYINKVSDNLIKKGKLTFFDNLLLFRNLLKKDAANGGNLIKHITSRHEYYLVDEFQDTDPLQSEIIFYLTAETPNEDYKLCKPKPGRLFIVGDPKQSIYRFRNADVVSYNFVKKLFKDNGDELVELTTNFRSHKKLIDYFNDQFKITFHSSYGGLQAPFSNAYYCDSDKDEPIVEGVQLYHKDGLSDPVAVRNIICNLIKKGYKYGDIMVLTRTKPQLKDYIEAFDNKAIPYEIGGQSMFEDCEPFINLRYLIGALANPDDSYYVYLALKQVLKISDSDIYATFNNKGPNLLNNTGNPKYDKLINFYKDNINQSANIIIDKIIEEFDLLNISKIKHLECLYYAKELLKDKLASKSIVTLNEVYKYFCELSNSDTVERSLSLSKEEREDRVLLANVHKVKGLQRKIVILTCNATKPESDPSKNVEVHSSFDEKKNYIIRIKKQDDSFAKVYYLDTNEYETQAQEEARAILCERDRIAYVAATRACDALFIATDSLSDSKASMAPWSELIKHDESASHFTKNDDYVNVDDSDTHTPVSSSSLKVTPTVFKDSIKNNTYEIKSPASLVFTEDESFKGINDPEALLNGSIVHRLLELYVSNNFKDSLDIYLSIISNEFIINSSHKQMLKEVYNAMNNGGYKQTSGVCEDLIGELKSADEVYTEVPFAYKDNNDIYNGIIDLLYKKNNNWFIVDYKTNYDDEELDKKYEKQLDAYKQALSTQDIKAEAYIYHIEIK